MGHILCDICTWNVLHTINILQFFYRHYYIYIGILVKSRFEQKITPTSTISRVLVLFPPIHYSITQNSILEWSVFQFEISKVFLVKKSILMFFFNELELIIPKILWKFLKISQNLLKISPKILENEFPALGGLHLTKIPKVSCKDFGSWESCYSSLLFLNINKNQLLEVSSFEHILSPQSLKNWNKELS